jgi:DnaJ-class molecular chaperone
LRKRGAAADKAYRRAARAAAQAETRKKYDKFQAEQATKHSANGPRSRPEPPSLGKVLGGKLQSAIRGFVRGKTPQTKRRELSMGVQRISVVEVSLSLRDAVTGVKKAIEISEPEGARKVSVKIPPGSRNGSVIHLRSTAPPGEELVLVVRVAAHPTMSLQPKGLVVEVPVTVAEALCGASVTVPTLDEPISIKIPAGSQSGTELRIRERGVLQKDGSRGDLFYRLMIKVPEAAQAVGLREKSQELDKYYESAVRQPLPRTLLE